MDATSSALINEIAINLEPLKNLSIPFYTDPNFIGAFLASIIALVIALFSEPFKKIWRRTKLDVSNDIVINKQGNGDSIHYRLLISNIGNYIAEDVEAYIVKVSNKDNFLPVPLTWTHARAYMTAGVYRNIHPHQPVLLDFCEFIKSRNLLKFRLAAGEEVADFCSLDGTNRDIILEIYQKSGEKTSVRLDLDWKEDKSPSFSLAS
jgi:hypothetical protein